MCARLQSRIGNLIDFFAFERARCIVSCVVRVLVMTSGSVGTSGGFPQTRQSLVGGLEDWADAGRWGEFARIYAPIILAMARKAGLRDADSQEVLQEVLLRVANCMQDETRRYTPEGGRFRGWLINSVRWKIGEQFKKVNRRARDGSGGTDEVLARVADESCALAVEEMEQQWQSMLFAAAVEKVKSKVSLQQFQVFQLNVLNGKAAKDVCEQLGVNRAQVYLAKHRVGHLVQNEVRRLAKQAAAIEREVSKKKDEG